ncbi:Leucine-rich repeat-containing protein 58 [Spatholobus suberectus]|nr:Leucine-rich repeat-containing protein 58 [Spatholobus suberectus]
MSDVYLGKAQNLLQALNMLPPLLAIELRNCGLNKLHTYQFVRATNFSRVEVLNLAENGLQAPFLDAFQNMTSIAEIDLSENNLNSTPFWLGTCINLVNLYVGIGSNALHGSLPSALQNLTSLINLDLSDNNVDSIPSWLDKVEKLWFFFVIALGYAIGFWAVIGSLLMKRSWRLAYFQFIDESTQRINGSWAIHLANFKERFTENPVAE